LSRCLSLKMVVNWNSSWKVSYFSRRIRASYALLVHFLSINSEGLNFHHNKVTAEIIHQSLPSFIIMLRHISFIKSFPSSTRSLARVHSLTCFASKKCYYDDVNWCKKIQNFISLRVKKYYANFIIFHLMLSFSYRTKITTHNAGGIYSRRWWWI
jgi:hypothetical protein